MIKKNISILVFGLISSLVFAEVPVVDYSSNLNSEVGFDKANTSVRPLDSLKIDYGQRVSKLEQQMNNINEQNLVSKINGIQERLQKLNGQIEDQAHQIEQLNTQLRDFYQDLNQRLDKSKFQFVKSDKAVDKTIDKSIDKTTDKAAAQKSDDIKVTSEDTVKAEGAVKDAPISNNTATSSSDDVGQKKSDKDFLKEQQMYQTAIDLLPDKKYEASESQLRDYLRHYPKGVYVANAHYWLGEINFLQKNYDAAEEEFKIVVTKYAKSRRISDASFKLALVHQNQGRDVQAKEELKKVIKHYPNTSAAQLAKLQLEGN